MGREVVHPHLQRAVEPSGTCWVPIFVPRVLLCTGEREWSVPGPFEDTVRTYKKARLLSLHRSPSPLKLEPHKPSFWFLDCANCFHALAPSRVLCPLSGDFSPLFG